MMWTNRSWEDAFDIWMLKFEDWMKENGLIATIRVDKKTEPNK